MPASDGVDAVAGGQVAGGELDAVRGRAGAAAEHAEPGAAGHEERCEAAAERAGAAGEQDRRDHGVPPGRGVCTPP
jgi:hypothetical protein